MLKLGKICWSACSSCISITCYEVYISTCWGGQRVWEQGLDRNLMTAFLLFPFLITLQVAASSLLSVLLTFVTADSVALPVSQGLHPTNDWVWVVCLPFLSKLCPFFHEWEPFIETSRKMYAQHNRLVSVPFNKLLYQALKHFYAMKHFIKELC